MNVFFSFCDGEGLAAVRRDQIDLADFVFGIGIGVVALPCCVLAFREEGDPLAVGGPLGIGVVSLGLATWLYLSRPSVEKAPSTHLELRPTPGGAMAAFGTRF